MLQLTDTKTPIRIGRARRRSSTAIAPARARAVSDEQSNAAPFTLAAVVVCGLLLAVTMAIVTALGG